MMYKILLLIFSLLILTGCNNTSIYPPSKFIGLYENYNGYKNGSLPFHSDYTGIWQNPDAKITGAYKNGIPCGVWKSYYQNSIIRNLMVYFEDGHFQNTCYYPDGLPRMILKGKYRFSENAFLASTLSREYWDFNGDLLGEATSSGYGVIPETPREAANSIKDYVLESFYSIQKPNFSVSIYLIPTSQEAAPYEKSIFSCYFDSNNKIAVTKKVSSGVIDLHLAEYSISNQTLTLVFAAKNLEEPRNRISIKFSLQDMRSKNESSFSIK